MSPPRPWPWPARLLLWALALAFAARAARGTPTFRPAPSWFARNGHRAWLAGPLVVVPAGLLLHPVYQRTQASPLDPSSVYGGWFLACAAATLALVVAGVVHATRYKDARRRPHAGTGPRAVGYALLGIAWSLVLLGALVTLPDPTSADYWTGALPGAALLAAVGTVLVRAGARRPTARPTTPTTNA